MKTKLIHDECWAIDLWLIWPAGSADVNHFLRCEFGIEEKTKDSAFVGRFVEVLESNGDEHGGVIALRQWKRNPYYISVLVHECLHATHWFLNRRGLTMTDDTDEAYAYLLDSLTRRCLEVLK